MLYLLITVKIHWVRLLGNCSGKGKPLPTNANEWFLCLKKKNEAFRDHIYILHYFSAQHILRSTRKRFWHSWLSWGGCRCVQTFITPLLFRVKIHDYLSKRRSDYKKGVMSLWLLWWYGIVKAYFIPTGWMSNVNYKGLIISRRWAWVTCA